MATVTLASLEALRSELANSKYYLNIRSGYMAPITLHCSYGDSGESIKFYIFDGGQQVDLTGASATVHGTRKDGASFGPFICTISEYNAVSFELQSSMTAVEGGGIAEIIISKGGATIGTCNFGILVEQAVFPNGIAYDSDPSIYQDILKYVQLITSRIENYIASGTAATDSELIDIRVKADGSTALSAGTAVREQFNDLKSNTDGVKDVLVCDTTYVDGYINNSGELVEDTSSQKDITSDFISVTPGMKLWFEILYSIASRPWLRVAEYNQNKVFRRRASNIYDSTTAVKRAMASSTVGNDTFYIRVSYATYSATTSHKLNIYFPSVSVYESSIKKTNDILASAWVYEAGNRRRIKIETYGTSLKVYVPDRLFARGLSDSMQTYDHGSYEIYTVPHNNYLYYDYLLNQLVQASESDYNLGITNPHRVLLYCSNGKALGEWSRYQQNETDAYYSAENFPTVEIINRQGQMSPTQGVYTPENSLIGCEEAKKNGFNRIRISVQFTLDDVPVAYHDMALGTGGKVYKDGVVIPTSNTTKINQLTLAQLQEYDFGVYADSSYEGTKISTLDDHVKQAKLMGYKLDLELKENVASMSNNQLLIIHNIVAKYGMTKNIQIGAYNISTLSYMKSLNSDYALCYEVNDLNTTNIDAVAALYDNNVVTLYCANSSFLNDYTEEIAIYASNNHVNLRCGTQTSAIDLPYYVQRLNEVECAYVNYPVTRLLS